MTRKKRLLQIDTCLGVGSTGRITESIAGLAQNNGWECYIVHGARYVKRPSCMKDIQTVSILGEYMHYAESLLLDNHGLSSRVATQRIVEAIKEIKPDIIHLHCIHGYYLNYKILFRYLQSTDIPLVWTFHDCWAFTGHCAHFVRNGCEKWKTVCSNCELRNTYPVSLLLDRTTRNHLLKKRLFTSVLHQTVIVPVSCWLEENVKESFFQGARIVTIHNGVDVDLFRTTENTQKALRKYELGDVRYVIGLATKWTERKGLKDYWRLASLMPEGVKIVLVGLDEKQIQEAEEYGIIGIARTENVSELVALYNGASIVMNLSYEETFGLTTVEGLACGTPGIVYNATASPELVTPETGIVCEPGDIDGVASAVRTLLSMEKPVEACRKRAVECFNMKKTNQEYLDLYDELIQSKCQKG